MKSNKDPFNYYGRMTPEERTEKITAILAEAAIKVALKDEKGMVDSEPKLSCKILKARLFDRAARLRRSGIAPFGYRKGDDRLTVNDTELVWVRRIQELSAQGLSTGKIARQLNKEDQVTKWAAKWDRSKVWRILKRT